VRTRAAEQSKRATLFGPCAVGVVNHNAAGEAGLESVGRDHLHLRLVVSAAWAQAAVCLPHAHEGAFLRRTCCGLSG
jgi:hypothetical protein